MNGHDSTREQNMGGEDDAGGRPPRARRRHQRAENGIGHLSCDDPKIMEQVRAHWRRLYATYMNADAIIADLESCARHLTDGDKWEPNPIADGLKPMEMAEELDDDSGGTVRARPVHPVFAPNRRRGPMEAGIRRFHSDP